MFALNLSDDGRILSATDEAYAADGMPLVNSLPDGDISDYRYADGEYVYDPLPKPEPIPSLEERIAELEAQNEMLMECLLEISEIIYA